MFGFKFISASTVPSASPPTALPPLPAPFSDALRAPPVEVTQSQSKSQSQSHAASDALDTYVTAMLQDPAMNVPAIPDAVEKFMYKRMIPGFMRCSKWFMGMVLQRIVFGQIVGRLGGKFGILKKLL